jgi:hypothetical protein
VTSLQVFAGLAAVAGFFSLVIWFSLSHQKKTRLKAQGQSASDELRQLRARFEGVGERRVWRTLVTDDEGLRVVCTLQDERREPRGTFTRAAGDRHNATLELGGTRYAMVVQARSTRFYGRGGGTFPDSTLVLEGKRVEFEAVPWLDGKRHGMRAQTAAGVLELIWEPMSARGQHEGAALELDGRRVGEVLHAIDGSGKLMVGFEPAFPEALAPWLFVMARAGVYERFGKKPRASFTQAPAPTPALVAGEALKPSLVEQDVARAP